MIDHLTNALRIEPRVPLDCRIVTATDHNLFLSFQLLWLSVTVSHDCRFSVVDLGMTDEQRAWCKKQNIDVRPRPPLLIEPPTTGWQTWNKPVYLDQIGGRVLWLDADTIVVGRLDYLDHLLAHRPVFTGDFAACHNLGFEKGWECLRNEPPLYRRYPVPRQLSEWPNGGVLAIDTRRDRQLLNEWLFMVGQCAGSEDLRRWVHWFDQGALAWAMERTGQTELILDDIKFNNPVSVRGKMSIDGLTRTLNDLPYNVRILHFAGQQGKRPCDGFGVDQLEIDLSTRRDVCLFVLGHDKRKLATIPDQPHVTKVFLPDLDPDNRLAENRIFQASILEKTTADYLGLCSQSWNTKYRHCRNIDRLHLLRMEPKKVWAGCRTDWRDGIDPALWPDESERDHKGILPLMRDVCRRFGLNQLYRVSLWSNNFVAHRDVVLDLQRFWRDAYEYLHGRYGDNPPFDNVRFDESRKWAYLGERITMVYFANRTDLQICPVPA